ncbi:Nucleotide-diphospho-sugar transferase [Glarea lozoyensis ATCC 20868]|uniref:Nucleotide-diphospho-sugar transferase n=1 Tax=Glarea lozoyensis (strain ATCC 20868 / MF5171) TaxID=1116229 RepID=S3CUT2_GLAL2|nr:Nucleotide-diphospho-sugar transferase [Glarea lozoyensis ATCC 20868]EPE30162.1 Nucleotide-diphospho-sugar transferase [Glarea lozoyensis ATCC 20868]
MSNLATFLGRMGRRRPIWISLLIAGVVLYLFGGGSAPSTPHEINTSKLNLTSKRYAFATLLTSDDDSYFTATRVLSYQLLSDQETKTNHSIPFVVMVTKLVPKHQRQRLALDGATVVYVEDVPLPWWIRQRLRRPSRFGDQFTKLRIFQMLEYDLVLYLDADTLLMKSLDGVFNDEACKPSDTQTTNPSFFENDRPLVPPAQYVFAARPDNGRSNDGSNGGNYEHPIPPMERDQLSAGFWVAAPSNELFNYYMSVMQSSTYGLFRPFDPQFMEQAMFDYTHRRDGRMPWKSLNYTWSATFPGIQDITAGVASLHDKFWIHGPDQLTARWKKKKEEMESLHGK